MNREMQVELDSFKNLGSIVSKKGGVVTPFEVALRCCFSLSFTGTILVGARRSLTIVFLVQNTGDAVQGVPLPNMNIVWRCATRASIDLVPASFLSQVICGTLYLLLPFLPLTICLLSNVGCTGTSEP